MKPSNVKANKELKGLDQYSKIRSLGRGAAGYVDLVRKNEDN
jgi:hypothetical protein